MKRTLYLPLALLLGSSCSQEEPERLLTIKDNEVAFFASLPEVATRSTYDLTKEIPDSGISVSTICPERDLDEKGFLPIHCQDAIVRQEVDETYRSADCKWPGNPDKKDGHLRFFAFHPSISIMKRRAGVGKECFIYSNQSTKDGSGVSYDYRLTKFRVAPDISKQVDFITSIGEGNKTEHLYSGIKLKFEHQLCGVQIGVWGAATLYDIEIAGVRIGGIVTEADFNLSDERLNPGDENRFGSWIISDKSRRGYVDYVYDTGDKVVTVNATSNNTKEAAAPIMGNGGKAMVIPYKYDKWDYKNDRLNQKNGAYFSVLLRMTQRDGDHHRIFPSTEPESADYIVYLSVRKSDGTVMKRLDKNGNIFGTSTKYTIPDTEELRHYGWAAVPVNVEWKAGYTYSYLLDYTKGVGVHDPADNNPASTIVNWDDSIDITDFIKAYGGKWGNGETIEIEEGGWGANTNNTRPDGTVWWK